MHILSFFLFIYLSCFLLTFLSFLYLPRWQLQYHFSLLSHLLIHLLFPFLSYSLSSVFFSFQPSLPLPTYPSSFTIPPLPSPSSRLPRPPSCLHSGHLLPCPWKLTVMASAVLDSSSLRPLPLPSLRPPSVNPITSQTVHSLSCHYFVLPSQLILPAGRERLICGVLSPLHTEAISIFYFYFSLSPFVLYCPNLCIN